MLPLFLALSVSFALPAWGASNRRCGQEFTSIPTPFLDSLQTQSITLTTRRLVLHTPQKEDLPRVLEIFSDPQNVEHTWFNTEITGEPWSPAAVCKTFEGFAQKQCLDVRRDFVIVRDGNVIGRCALYPYSRKPGGSWEFGITLDKAHWGNRYAEEVIRRMLRYVFVEMVGVEEVWFRTVPEHHQMLVQYERMGIPLLIGADQDTPEPPSPHRYHHFAVTRNIWQRSFQVSGS